MENKNTTPPDLDEVFGHLSKAIDNCLQSISNANPYIVFVALIGMAIWIQLGGGFINDLGESAKASWSDSGEIHSYIQIIIEYISIFLTLLAYVFLIISARNAKNKGYVKLSERLASGRVLVFLVFLFGLTRVGVLGHDGYNGLNLFSDSASFIKSYNFITVLIGLALILKLITFTICLGDEACQKQIKTQDMSMASGVSRFRRTNQTSKIKRRKSQNRL